MHNLHDTIIRLKKVIKNYESTLMGYEALTRSTLIDPLLSTLGWDVADPAVVRPEHPIPEPYKAQVTPIMFSLLSLTKPA